MPKISHLKEGVSDAHIEEFARVPVKGDYILSETENALREVLCVILLPDRHAGTVAEIRTVRIDRQALYSETAKRAETDRDEFKKRGTLEYDEKLGAFPSYNLQL